MEIADAIMDALRGPRGGEIATLVQRRAREQRAADVGSIRQIQQVVANEYRVTHERMVSRERTASVARARQVAMYLSRLLTPASYPEIGREFCRDHSTVMHSVRAVETRLADQDARTVDVVGRVTRLLRGE